MTFDFAIGHIARSEIARSEKGDLSMKFVGVKRPTIALTLASAVLSFALAVGAIVAGVSANAKEQAALARKLSPAEALLFDRPHLLKIEKPSVLNYRFKRKTTADDGFEDFVRVKIDRIKKNGARDVSFEFLTGNRQRPYGTAEDLRGNPLVMLFLNYDIWAQSRAIGGKANYFRNRIRDALRDTAKVEDVTVQRPDGPIKAQKITIEPYLKDRYKDRFKEYQFKIYEFIMSPDIMGEVVNVRTIVPAKNADKKDAQPLIEESLTFENMSTQKSAQKK